MASAVLLRIGHPLLEMFNNPRLTVGVEIASASPPAALNSTIYVPSFFGP
jgi:hypothetical protein